MRSCSFIILVILTCKLSFAQNEPTYRPIDKTVWEKTVEGLNYDEAAPDAQKPKEEKAKENKSNFEGFNINNQLFQLLGFILIIAGLVFLLFKLFGQGLFTNKKVPVQQKNTLYDLDERPMETDLERYLREALEKGDFRLAIRIYYLMILRILHDKNFIEWKKNKTNLDYLNELNAHPVYHQMSNNTLLYEFIWYGEKILVESQFKQVSNSFTDLITQLSNIK